MPHKKIPLEEILLKRGLLTGEQLNKAKEEARRTGSPLKQVLIKLNLVAEEDIASLVAEHMGVPYIDLSDYLIDPATLKLVPEALAKRYKLMPVFKVANTLTVAMADPQDLMAIDEIRLKSGCDVEPCLSGWGEIKDAIDQYYGVTGTMAEVIEGIDEEKMKRLPEEMEIEDLAAIAEEAPIIKLVNLLIMQAVKDRASDIHVEPDEDTLRTRFRVDGVLHEVSLSPKHLQPAIVSRIKILSKIDIAEKRRPQDGRFGLKIEDKEIDIRVSTYPTVYGENVVMRILDKSSVMLGLTELGFAGEELKKFDRLIKRPYGIILVTGPTGCGKTTTLYAALQTINSEDKNIVTIEDPVEYNLKLIRQSQVNPKAGVNFATGLRSILRQDPDVIMVGEVRDRETAEIAIQSALTGHLVFSTLHTNDAPGAMTRLIDMGVEPFLISSSVIGVLAERLVRIICDKCKESFEPSAEMLAEFGLERKREATLYRGKGCPQCKNTGYRGRVGIFELMFMDEQIKRLVMARASTDEIREKARAGGMKTLREDGLTKVIDGRTTVEEVLKATREV